jgi:hypothetical protein
LPSSNWDVGLLFATSSFSWILCLKLGGVLFCPPAAKRAVGPHPGVVVAVASSDRPAKHFLTLPNNI